MPPSRAPRTSAALLPKVRRDVRRLMEGGRGSHGYDHAKRVLALCRRLGRERGADLEILSLAALLHDVGRREEDRSDGRTCHAAAGSRLAGELLEKHGAPAETVRRVKDCVRQHRYRDGVHPVSLEAKILYDADKIDSLGAVGVGRAFLFAGEVGARLHNSEKEARSAGAYTREDTAYREFVVKLRGLPEKLQTEEGRVIAGERLRFMEAFFHRLADETKGRM